MDALDRQGDQARSWVTPVLGRDQCTTISLVFDATNFNIAGLEKNIPSLRTSRNRDRFSFLSKHEPTGQCQDHNCQANQEDRSGIH